MNGHIAVRSLADPIELLDALRRRNKYLNTWMCGIVGAFMSSCIPAYIEVGFKLLSRRSVRGSDPPIAC